MNNLLKALTQYKWLGIVSIFIFVSGLTTIEAEAHAKLLSSRPGSGEILHQSPKTIELTFNTQLQPVSMNSIVVTDANNRRFDKNNPLISDFGKKMQIELEELTSGTFTVEWKALSDDNHPIKGRFNFQVLIAEANNSSVSEQMPQIGDSNEAVKMSIQQSNSSDLAIKITRWLSHLAIMTIFGGLVFQLLILRPVLQKMPVLDENERFTALRNCENRFFYLAWLSFALLFFSVAANLILQTSTLLDVTTMQALSPLNFFKVLKETGFGFQWLLQMSAALALFIIFIFAARARRGDELSKTVLTTKPSLLLIGLVICTFLILTFGSTGHARAAAKDYRLAIISNWFHLISCGIWVGGLFHLAITLPKSFSVFSSLQRTLMLSRIISRFSSFAVIAVTIITLTGIYNTWIHIDDFSALLNSSYGLVLTAKIILFLPMLVLGGLNTFVLRPAGKSQVIRELDSVDESVKSNVGFFRSVRTEAIIGVILLLLASILSFLPTARRHDMPMNHHHTSPTTKEKNQ